MSGTTFLHFINNSFVASTPERYFDKHSPVDGSLLGGIAEGGAPEVDAAVRAARADYLRQRELGAMLSVGAGDLVGRVAGLIEDKKASAKELKRLERELKAATQLPQAPAS